ncbi:MAG: hypothetical protein ABIJ40_03570 [Bacteroidota bacterium]
MIAKLKNHLDRYNNGYDTAEETLQAMNELLFPIPEKPAKIDIYLMKRIRKEQANLPPDMDAHYTLTDNIVQVERRSGTGLIFVENRKIELK